MSELSDDDLKPCPFCGGKATIGFEDFHNGGHIICECGAIGPVWANDTDKCVIAWNKRAPDKESFDAGWDKARLLLKPEDLIQGEIIE